MKLSYKILVSLVLISALLYGGYNVSKSRTFQVFGNLFYQSETDAKIVALTFDDGPTEKTEQILQVLEELDVKATFYLTGNELVENLRYGEMIVNAGHELGNHSYSHKRMLLRPYDFIKDEVDSTNSLIRSVGYEGEITFRPPYCKRLLLLPYYLSTQGITTVTWNLEPETVLGYDASAEDYSDYVIKNISPGSVVLMHVMYEKRSEALDAVKLLVPELKSEGYEFVTINEMMNGVQ